MNTNLPIRLKACEEVHGRYFEVIPPGFSFAEVMTGDFWVHVRRRLKLYDVIEVVAADGSFDCDIRVVSLNQLTGIVWFKVLREVHGGAVAVPSHVDDRYAVKHQHFGKYAVIERTTGIVIAEGIDKLGAEEAKREAEAAHKDKAA